MHPHDTSDRAVARRLVIAFVLLVIVWVIGILTTGVR